MMSQPRTRCDAQLKMLEADKFQAIAVPEKPVNGAARRVNTDEHGFQNLRKSPQVFGLRRKAKRHAAFECNRRPESGVVAALCHRTPGRWHAICRAFIFALLFSSRILFAQEPFQFPTANHYLYERGSELKFFAPTAPDKPWTSGSFGCVRNDGQRLHEGLDILHLQTGKRGEPADPVMATADGAVVYFTTKPSLSNYGNYIVVRHVVKGIEIYSLYAHLSAIQPGIVTGKNVKQGEVIATMGRTSNAEAIAKNRAHVHFELNLLVNDNFAAWFKKSSPGERNDHGEWNGQNLNGLNPREILLQEHNPNGNFSLLNYIRSQTELCRVLVRATNFPYLKRYPMLVLRNPVAEKEGVAGYEIALNLNGVAFVLMPRAASEIKSPAKYQLLSVNETEEKANPCRHLVVRRNGRWQLANEALRELELLTY
jgi:murein DD-endopeptidase MepM/ murein hydrolase activator NlpD